MIITSAYPPQDIYESREDLEQLIRRIDEIKIFGKYIKNGEESESED